MSTENKSKKDDADKIVPSAPPISDVSKPGNTAADPSSRPIIVTHKPMMKQDPMMKDNEKDSDKDEEAKTSLKVKKEAKLEPPTIEKPEPDEETAEETSSDKTEEKSSEETQFSSDSGAIDALADEAGSKRADQKARDEAVKKQVEIDKLVASKKYNLPIHDGVVARSGAGTVFVNSFLALLVLAAGVVLAIDAGYLDLPLELPFDLIK